MTLTANFIPTTLSALACVGLLAGATIVVPLETLLTEQITLRVDGGQARRFPFNFCNVGGCVTRVGLTSEDVALFRRGAEATLTMVPAAAPDQTVTVQSRRRAGP